MDQEQKYVVKVFSLFSNFVEINAKDEEEAIKKAKNILFSEKKDELPLQYEGTLPESHWLVVTGEELENLKNSQNNLSETKEKI